MKNKDLPTEPTQRQLDLGILRDNLGYLTRIARTVVRQSAREYVSDLGFATGQITLLGLIAANDGVSQNDLAHALQMRKSQATGLIQDLVARGFVERIEMDLDRRYKALSLTSSGTTAWREARKRMMGHSDALLSSFSATEHEMLLNLMRKLIAANMPDRDRYIDIDYT
jgi:DNA-binding MarR family transcriptional regulator